MRPALFTLAGLIAISGCVTAPPVDSVAKGKLRGQLVLAYDNSDSRFIFLPVQNDPLTYLTSKGRKIRPSKMYTDGGSIPRIFWSVEGLSPWAYGPAYAIHDYLFNQHRCSIKKPRADIRDADLSIDDANDVLYDAMLIIEQKVRKEAQRDGRRLSSDEAFATGRSRTLVKSAVNQFGSSSWNSNDCIAAPEDKYVVTKVTGAPRTINDKGSRVFFELPQISGRQRSVRRLVPPTKIITYSFD